MCDWGWVPGRLGSGTWVGGSQPLLWGWSQQRGGASAGPRLGGPFSFPFSQPPLLPLFPSLNPRFIQAAPSLLPYTKRSGEEEGGLVTPESQDLLSFVPGLCVC